MKSVFKSLIVAFSMYSKIPMPRFQWASKDMEYHLCFFPLVGAVIGILELLWFYFCSKINASSPFTNLFAVAIPLLVTGGFHIDGFMDTMDAIHSYQDKENKLEILKDPHIGAFSVICVISFFIVATAFTFEIKTYEGLLSVCFAFVLSRILSGISVITFPKAKKNGMLATESKTDSKKIIVTVLLIELIVVSAVLVYFTFNKSFCGLISIISIILTFTYYYFMSKKHFGGITGDLAGFFICISELVSLIAIVGTLFVEAAI
ncbi:adenosylcobinamide-GDP ribazoletransferase [Treponema sp.]|uniref:adenosylcobinamide-GDP ribazoletransferase n=1 Tax=Treponema sp. TaxID=166 RepID=UPI00298D8010|nr:adenosylcobinamide-GDP ribazoletransferase [Treponema sp.]MCQ2240053.1 adenosylcobinamide-GDP ribazoletransferase [Treponema sp.]